MTGFGLHASADSEISQAELDEFRATRPDLIKLLSYHNPQAVAALAAQHPLAAFLVRPFLDFGLRRISPAQFVEYTWPDTERTLRMIGPGRNVTIELHNEPNLVAEGLGTAWEDGYGFADWWTDVVWRYRGLAPGTHFIYPGLSPGNTIPGVREDSEKFLNTSYDAIRQSNGMGLHCYWTDPNSYGQALELVDHYAYRFPRLKLWVTEAANVDPFTAANDKAYQYITFWRQLAKRPAVQGVAYFVASASNPKFAPQVWVGRGIGAIVGRRNTHELG